MLFEEYWSELSSANSLHTDNILEATSLTYIKNKSGAKTDPWGTPADNSDLLDKRSLYITFWDLWHK